MVPDALSDLFLGGKNEKEKIYIYISTLNMNQIILLNFERMFFAECWITFKG